MPPAIRDNTATPSVRREVEALHEFFVSWFSGVATQTDAYFERGFSDRFHPEFTLIAPNGTTSTLARLSDAIYRGYGNNPGFRIAIRNVVVRWRWEGNVLATYEEWQRNARASQPPDNGRGATVLFAVADSLRWLHVHETWLPMEVMQAGPYDF